MQAKTLLLWLLCGMLASESYAQITRVLIGVNGLTCSQCTRNVEMQLRRLPFVSDVAMDLEQTNGVVFLKQEYKLQPEAIAAAIKNAGFSTRYLKLELEPPIQAADTPCFSVGGMNFQLADSEQHLGDGNGKVIVQLLDKPFQADNNMLVRPVRHCKGKVYLVKKSDE